MAEKNSVKMSAFEEEQVKTLKKIVEYKRAVEANIIGILYQEPSFLFDSELLLTDFSNNVWKVYFEIIHDLIVNEKKVAIDDIVIGKYLEKHPKLKEKYHEYGGYKTVYALRSYINIKNYTSEVAELKKWEAIFKLCKYGFPVSENFSIYADKSLEEIYEKYEVALNNIFIYSEQDVKTYNAFDGIFDFIEELDAGQDVGLPFHNADLLTNEVGGFNINGNIYGLGAASGVGKSTMAFNYLVPTVIERKERIVFIINEEDERKIKRELLIWVANNIILKNSEEKIHKYQLRNGNFKDEVKEILYEAGKWIDDKKEEHILTVIPLERYSVNIVIKIIKKYATAFGVRMFVLDTLKESFDAKTDEIYKSMMRDMVALYDVVKPSAKNVGLFVTYQLSKSSVKVKHLTNNEIGQAKSIMDVFSVNLMMRRAYDKEYDDIKGYTLVGMNDNTKLVNKKLIKGKNYMITFVTKNRFGKTDERQIVSECDLSTNIYKDVFYCNIGQDW